MAAEDLTCFEDAAWALIWTTCCAQSVEAIFGGFFHLSTHQRVLRNRSINEIRLKWRGCGLPHHATEEKAKILPAKWSLYKPNAQEKKRKRKQEDDDEEEDQKDEEEKEDLKLGKKRKKEDENNKR